MRYCPGFQHANGIKYGSTFEEAILGWVYKLVGMCAEFEVYHLGNGLLVSVG